MRSICAAVSATVAVGIGVGAAPTAWAYNPSINGTYTATQVGNFARTGTVYHDEDVVRSTWRISTSCSTAQDCSGTVVSDQGWTAPLVMHDGQSWNLKRDIPNWEPCDDGSSFTGREHIFFYPADPETGEMVLGSAVFAGREHTTGPSGACGTNAPLYIEQPFRLDRIG